MEKNGTKSKIIIIAILIIIGIANCLLSIYSAESRNEPFALIHMVIDMIMYLLVAWYTFWGYKKPHGNMLRMTLFLFSVYVLATCIIPSADLGGTKDILVSATAGLAALTIAYISGRLNKPAQNKGLAFSVGVLMLVGRLLVISAFPSNIIRMIGVFAQLIIWIVLWLAYTARYEEHKAAGLEDK